MDVNPWAIGGIALVAGMTFYLGFRGSRPGGGTPDFLVARRFVRSRRNAATISGEYLSVASFLGIAGLILKYGVDSLWYAIGFTAGYLTLLMFVAAPVRRSGAYTLPDFVEARLGHPGMRRLCTAVVALIGTLYLLPQLRGAGLTLAAITPVPPWLGEVLVVGVVLISVFGGGMRSITVVGAFQYWLKLFALMVPAFVLIALFIGDHSVARPLSATGAPVFTSSTTITLPRATDLRVGATVRFRAYGVIDNFPTAGETFWSAGTQHHIAAGATLTFPAGATAPVVVGAPLTNADWLRPESGGISALLGTYSLIVALFLGTMGLPHVLARFYTNPDGHAARRTTLHVLLLLGLFYVFPTILGLLARFYEPELLVTGQTDEAVLLLPMKLLPGLAGHVLGAVIAAGAFAAFLATSSGLLVSIAGLLSTDVLSGRRRDFTWAAVAAGLVALVLAVSLPTTDVAVTVGLAFALAASTFGPVLLLGIWWRGLTWFGAAAGMVVGGGLVLAALVSGIVTGWSPWVITQPALISVPAAFLMAFLGSKVTARHIPSDVNRMLLRLHAPDRLGFIRDRDLARLGAAGERTRFADGRHHR